MILSPGQFYCVSLHEKTSTIQLDIILEKSTEMSAENRKDLVKFFQSTLEQIRQEMMAAATKPVCYIPCPHCPDLHIKYTNIFEGRAQLCKTTSIPLNYYQDLYQNIQGTYVLYLSQLPCLISIVTSAGVSEIEQIRGTYVSIM